MADERLGERLNISEELILESLSLNAQKSPGELFLVKQYGPSDVVFSFTAGSLSVESYYSGGGAFGEAKADLKLFPSLRSIGNYDPAGKPEEKDLATATINQAFLNKFKHVLENPQLEAKVQEAINLGMRIIFTGHSVGGAIAALATIWFLENFPRESVFCVTFGSPLIGDHLISHALRRENWSQYFINFVMRYDIVPRILLAPLSSIHQEFEKIIPFFDPYSPNYANQSIGSSPEALQLFTNVMSNASSVASSAASKLMGSPNLLLETVANFLELSPYKPFGTYIFCTGNEKLVVLKNPEAVLQLLFFTCQLSNEGEWGTIASKCLNQHLGYKKELEDSLEMQSVTYDDHLETVALASDGIFDDLGLSARARQCLRAAGVFEEQKQKNKGKFDSKKEEMKIEMKKLQDYRDYYEHNEGYYDAFKLQKNRNDFEANVTRLVLAAIWDEITEMLKKYDLPDEFEAISEWVELGTEFRHLVEPLDIANFYRHAKGEDTGVYMKRGRPKRYKYTQRWLEHKLKLAAGSRGESCFWAELEELHKLSGDLPAVNKEKERVLNLQRQVGQWIEHKVLREDVLKSSTFQQWWSKLPNDLKTNPILGRMNECENKKGKERKGNKKIKGKESYERLGEMLSISEELIKKSCYLSFQAHKFPDDLFRVEKFAAGSSDVVFSFPGSWSVESWASVESAFGDKKIQLSLFPSMKSVGYYDEAAGPDEHQDFATASFNQAFLQKFEHLLQNSQLKNKVQEAINEKKRIVFTGHSTGGATAVLTTIWCLENYPKQSKGTFFCVTFGSPLIGNHIISHAVRRENWSQYFIHIVKRYDIVPRILLAPLSSIQHEFERILPFFDPNSPAYASESIGSSVEAFRLFTNVMRNAASLTTHAASKLQGSTNLLLETVKKFVKLSPYKPFGTYIFCTGNGNLVLMKNPEAVLQVLFYSCQSSSETEWATIVLKCLKEHLAYENELEGSLDMQSVTCDDNLETLPLASDGFFDDLGLSEKARLCLRAAGEFEKHKRRNQEKVSSKMEMIRKHLKVIEEYRALCEHTVGYYDAFKIHKDKTDFKANLSRIELTGIWDEIIEMLKRYDLPDELEATKEWINLGTRFRRLVEPLDVANYYRHSKDEDTGPYMKTGRPKRYKCTQRWLEHDQKLQTGSCGESCFWADVEELHKLSGNFAAVYGERERVLRVQEQVGKWIQDGLIGTDVLLKSSTFEKWWSKLPTDLKTETISRLMNGLGNVQAWQ
ncbi:unnamed protein product [Malus baccata var. baccata]